MNLPDGKLLLATVRQGDFAHAGEEAAVVMAWEPLPKRKDQLCLDAGCGRGGTAAFVQFNGWGDVTGLDVDAETIDAAAKSYPELKLVAADVAQAGELFPAHFDLIYAFNAFYAFPDQQAALRSLRLAAKPGGLLCLFDYVDRGCFQKSPFARKAETLLWHPLQLSCLKAQLVAAGWQLNECIEIHSCYRQWYAQLVERFSARRQELLQRFDPSLVIYAEDYYRSLLDAIVSGALGGAIAYASPIAGST